MKKENVNGKKGKGCLVVIGVVVALGVLGSCFWKARSLSCYRYI